MSFVSRVTDRGRYAHVSDVEAGVDEEDVPGDDEAGQLDRDEVDVGEGQVEGRHQDLVRQRVQETAHHRRLALVVAGYPTVQLEEEGPDEALKFIDNLVPHL